MPPVLTDAVVDDARRGDTAALTSLYEAVSPGILAYLRSRGSADPEGLTQEVFVQLLPRVRSITGGAAGVRALSYTIAHSRLVDEFRRRGRAVEMPYEPDLDLRSQESAESTSASALVSHDVHVLLATLGDDQRTVILLRVLGDLSLEDTAASLGKSVGAVKQLQRRALLTLRDRVVASRGES